MIVGMTFSSITAKIDEDQVGAKGLNVSSTPNIVSVEKAEVLDMKDVVRVRFNFTTKYEPAIGEVSFEGSVLWRGTDSKKMLKAWEDEKKLDSKAAVDILNAIFRRCLAKAIVLAEDVRLPPPIQFPIVKEQEAEKKE